MPPTSRYLWSLLSAAPGSGGSARWSSCRGSRSGSASLCSSGMICLASALPSSTPHWSKESMPQIVALGEHAVLVERHQRAQRVRGEALGEDRVGRAVALHHAVRDDRLRRCPPRAPAPRSCRTRAPPPARTRWTSAGRGARRAGSAAARSRSGRPGSASCPGGSAGRSCAGRWCPARPSRSRPSGSPPRRPRASRACRLTPSSSCCRYAGKRLRYCS